MSNWGMRLNNRLMTGLVFTYRQIMELVLNYNGRSRAIIPIPWLVAKMQAGIIERLPVPALLSITRDQVEQLKSNNVGGVNWLTRR